MLSRTPTIILAIVLATLSHRHAGAAALGTSFTYQGQLSLDGEPAIGAHDFVFRLYGAASGGSQIGAEYAVNGLLLSDDGRFTATVDFGLAALNGEARWLEVAVHDVDAGQYVTLAPRQPLTATPYALQTRGLYVDAAGRLALGEPGPAQSLLEVRGGGFIVHDTPSSGPSEGIALLSDDIRFDAVTGDTVYRYSGVTDTHEFSTGLDTVVQPRMVIDSEGRVGIGATSPAARVHVEGGSDSEPGSGGYAVLGSVTGKNLSLDNNEIMARDNGAISPLFLNADGGAVVIGASTAPSGTALAVNGTIGSMSGGVRFPDGSVQTSAPAWKMTVAGDAHLPTGNAGVGTAAPSAALHLSRPLQETAIRLQTTRSNSGPPATIENHPGSVAVLGAGAPWSTPQNAQASDDLWATTTLTEVVGGTDVNPSKDLVFSNFGFNLPASANVVAVEVSVEAHATESWTSPTTGASVLVFAQVEGNDTLRAFEVAGATDTTSSMTFNLGLTGTQVNASSFAVRVRSELELYYYDCGGFWPSCGHYVCDDCAGTATVSIDHVKVKLYYHDASATLTSHDFSIGVPADSDVLVIGPGPSPLTPAGNNGKIVVTEDGKVGINMIPLAEHGAKLQVNGTVRCTNLLETSSRRFKRDVRPLENALQTVSRLRGVSYTWDERHGAQPDIGFIAEEVGAVLPEIVEYEADGVHAAGMKYDRIGALAVEAIKQLKQQLDEKNAQIDAQGTQLNEQQRRLEALESALRGVQPAEQ